MKKKHTWVHSDVVKKKNRNKKDDNTFIQKKLNNQETSDQPDPNIQDNIVPVSMEKKNKTIRIQALKSARKKKRIVTDKNHFDPKNKKKSRNQFKALNRRLQLT